MSHLNDEYPSGCWIVPLLGLSLAILTTACAGVVSWLVK